MSVNYNIFSYIFPSYQIVEGWYLFCIIPNRNKRWSLLSHYGDVDFLVRSHSCCRSILYFKQIQSSVFFSNKIKAVPYSIQFYCNFCLMNNPSFCFKFSDSPIDFLLTFLVWSKSLCLSVFNIKK